MDLFKRIQDLSAIYDDDGPSAMVPESRNTIAGGNIIGETIGDRTGFRKPKYVPTKNSFIVTDRTNKTVGTFKVEDYKNKTEAKKAANTLDKKMSAEAEERRIKTQEKNRTKYSADRTNYKKSINNWTQNWMDNNIKNYDLRDADTFIKDLKSDFKKEFNLKSPAKSLPSNIEGFPNIGTAAKSAKAAFTPYGITPLKRTGGEKATFAAYETFFRRAFLTNKIENDSVLKNRISNYLDYTTMNKPGGSFALDKIKLKYADTLNNLDDVMYVLSDDTKVLNLAKKNLFGNIFPQYDKFRAKENSSMISRKNNISKIEKTLGPKKLKELLNGETSIDKFLINEGKALKKFFDVSELPGSLKYSIDHNIGISDISKLSKEEMERSLNSLIGMTVKRNKDLGWGGYSRTKQSLINKINQGKNVSGNLDKLNEITTAAYGPELKGKQAYNLVDGKLTFTEDFNFRTNPEERFKTYFTEINKTPEGSSAIKKQYGNLNNLLLKLSGQIDPDCKQASADGGRIGLKTIGSPNVCITKARNYMSEELTKGIGTQQNAKTSLIKRILAGSANFLKQNLSPKELFKMENLIGKPALYGAAAFETGLVADDVLRKGKPLNVSAAESLFGSVLNLDADAARAKNLLESNTQLSPAAKEYAQNILDYDKYRKLDLNFPSSLVAKSMPGSEKYFKMQEDLKKKIESTPDTGAFDYKSALDESEGAFKAKPKKLFGLEIDSPDAPEVTPLTNKFAQPPGRRVGPMTAKQGVKIDLTPLTYQNFKPDYGFTKEQFEDVMRKEGALADDQIYQDNFYKQEVEKPIEFEQLMKLPSFRGASEKFAGGGIAKMAGDRSGAMTKSMNPDSQGLSYLFNRVKKI